MHTKTNVENIFFYVALFAVLFAGDMVWWHGTQSIDAIDQASATIVRDTVLANRKAVSRTKELQMMQQAKLDVDWDKELSNLEKDVKDLDDSSLKDVQQLQTDDGK